MGVAAFFDLDGTVLSTSSALLYVKYLRARPPGKTPFDRLPLTSVMRTLWYQLLYSANRIDMERVVAESARPLRGHPERMMIDLCRTWFEEVVTRFIRPEMPELIDSHRRAGHQICMLTGSTPYVTVPTCERLGIPHWLSTRLEVADDGMFTGGVVRPLCYGAGKIHWAKNWAAEREIDLARSFFYTDSYTDLPMCEAVGKPILVAPDRRMRKVARERRWPILELDGRTPFRVPDLAA